MSTNGVNNVEDADMADCDGEKVVTMMDVLQEQQDFEDDANAVLGASDDKNCTYSKGYIKRQAIYACMTCCSEAKDNPTKRAGVCLACSLNCHENHELIELYTKRNFRCDCGNPKFNSHPCQYTSNKSDLNIDNKYNQNFAGLYCNCHRPYPDPEATEEDEMIQCIVCEDWLHTSHLDAVVPGNDQYSEMICKTCMEMNEFLQDYSSLAVNVEMAEVDITTINTDIKLKNGDLENDKLMKDEKDNDIDEPAKMSSEETAEKKLEIENGTTVENEHQQIEAPVNDGTENVSKEANIEDETTEKSLQEYSDNICKDDTNTNLTIVVNSTQDLKETASSECLQERDDTSEDNISENIETLKGETSKPEATKETTEEFKEVVKDTTENIAETKVPTEEADNSKKNDQLSESMEIDEVSTKEMKSTETTSEHDQISENTANEVDQKENVDSTVTKSEDKQECVNITINENTDISEDTKPTSTEEENKPNATLNDTVVNESINDTTENTDTLTKESLNKIEESTNDKSPDTAIEQEVNGQNKESDEIPETVTNTSLEEKDKVPNMDHFIIEFKENKRKLSTEEEVNGYTNKESDEIPETVNNTLLEEKDKVPDTENVIEEFIQNKENKRKLSTEEVTDEISVKKPKLDEEGKCTRPKGVMRLHKGAVFWPSNFRQKLCTCRECLSMYKDLSVLFLIDAEDTVSAYETLGKEKINGRATQYEKGLEALSSLDRIQQINAMTEYNKMRDKLLDYLKSFKDRKEIVKEEDIKAFFAGMTPKREPDGVYFCR